MQYTYSTFIEMVRGKDFRIVGVANNPLSRNDIPINILSKGKAFGCIELKYSIKTPLENGGYMVYTIDGKKEDYKDDEREFLPMKINGIEPTINDFYIYKTISSANARVKDINSQLEKEKINAEAVCVEFKTNRVY